MVNIFEVIEDLIEQNNLSFRKIESLDAAHGSSAFNSHIIKILKKKKLTSNEGKLLITLEAKREDVESAFQSTKKHFKL
jgi:hypothetical protein